MRGGHDLGGRQGFGPIDPEPESAEPVFHSDWERRVFAITLATGMLGRWNIDQSRHARERQHPVDYLRQSYYENWLAGTEKLLLESGLISTAEIEHALAAAGPRRGDCGLPSTVADSPGQAAETESGQPNRPGIPGPEDARRILRGGGPATREISASPRFAIGDTVLARRQLTAGHTRAPGYAQGCRGRVHVCHGAHVFPDANSKGDPLAHYLYSVAFDSRALWGKEAEPFEVLIDLWEPYLAGANELAANAI